MPRKRKNFHDLPREKYQALFAPLTLAEVQVLLLGLWVIGEQNRVDPKLIVAWRTLRGQLQIVGRTKATE